MAIRFIHKQSVLKNLNSQGAGEEFDREDRMLKNKIVIIGGIFILSAGLATNANAEKIQQLQTEGVVEALRALVDSGEEMTREKVKERGFEVVLDENEKNDIENRAKLEASPGAAACVQWANDQIAAMKGFYDKRKERLQKHEYEKFEFAILDFRKVAEVIARPIEEARHEKAKFDMKERHGKQTKELVDAYDTLGRQVSWAEQFLKDNCNCGKEKTEGEIIERLLVETLDKKFTEYKSTKSRTDMIGYLGSWCYLGPIASTCSAKRQFDEETREDEVKRLDKYGKYLMEKQEAASRAYSQKHQETYLELLTYAKLEAQAIATKSKVVKEQQEYSRQRLIKNADELIAHMVDYELAKKYDEAI